MQWGSNVDLTEQAWITESGDGFILYDKPMKIYCKLDEQNSTLVTYACVLPNTNTDKLDITQLMYIYDRDYLIIETVHLKTKANRITVYKKYTPKTKR